MSEKVKTAEIDYAPCNQKTHKFSESDLCEKVNGKVRTWYRYSVIPHIDPEDPEGPIGHQLPPWRDSRL